MNFHKNILKNRLRVITVPMPSMESATVQIIVGAGTRHEEKRANGLAHFLEHMVFKGTKKYPSAQTVSSAVDSIGAEMNANTDRERTAYFIKAWERHLPLAFDILSGFINEPLLDPEEIEREKGVIIEEIAMYDDLPMQKVGDVFEELLYKDSPLSWDVAGTKETVQTIKQDDFLKYRKRLYYPKNMVLAVAGKFDEKEVLGLAEEYFGGTKKSRLSDVRGQMPGNQISDSEIWQSVNRNLKSGNLNPSGKPEVKLVTKKTEQAHLVLGVRSNPLGHPDRYIESVLAAILGGGMSSRLFTEIRERRGLAYYVRCSPMHYTDNGHLTAHAGVRLDKIEEAIRVILSEYGKIKSSQVSKKELQKAKEYIKGKFALSLEDTFSMADFVAEQEVLENRIETAEGVIKGIDKVAIKDIQRVAKEFFVNSRLNLAIIGPYEDETKFERLLKL